MKLRRALTRVAFISFSMILVISAPRSVAAQEVPDFLVTSRSAHSFDDTLDLLRQAIAGQNLMLINEVNPQQMLRMVGVTTGGMRQIFFFHPRYMEAILERNRNAGIVPPLKILVMESPDGGVMVRYHDPVDLFAPYAGVGEVAEELRDVFQGIVEAVRP